jgi:hypothetical protein
MLTKRIYALFETSLIIFGLWEMLTTFPLLYFYDGMARFSAMQGLLQGKISNVSYSFVGPIFSLPLFLAEGWHLATWLDPNKYNVFLFIAFIFAVYALFRNHIDHSVLRKFFLILITASMFGDQIKFFGGETFTATLVGFGVLAVTFAPSWLGWVCIVLGVVNTPAALIGLLCLSAKKVWSEGSVRVILTSVLAAIVTIIAIMAESWIRRGSPLNGGYGDQTFNVPFLIGLLSIIFSFNKGLLFFTPGLFLPVKQFVDKQIHAAYTLWVSFVIGLILIYCKWWAWDGALFWGPRFFLVACIPASFALAVRLHKPSKSMLANVLTLIVLAWSTCVGIDGAIFDLGDLFQFCTEDNYKNGRTCQYDPYYSPLGRAVAAHSQLPHDDKVFIAYSLLVFAYLASPLVIFVARQVLAEISKSGYATSLIEILSTVHRKPQPKNNHDKEDNDHQDAGNDIGAFH